MLTKLRKPPNLEGCGKRPFSLFFGTSKKLQNYQIEPFVEYRQANPHSLMVTDIDYKLKMYHPKRLNVMLNWLSLHTFLKKEKLQF